MIDSRDRKWIDEQAKKLSKKDFWNTILEPIDKNWKDSYGDWENATRFKDCRNYAFDLWENMTN